MIASEMGGFYHHKIEDMKNDQKTHTHLQPAPHFFMISCLAWLHYTALTVTNEREQLVLFPLITSGKYEKQHQQMGMPISLQIHPVVADGITKHNSMQPWKNCLNSWEIPYKNCFQAQ